MIDLNTVLSRLIKDSDEVVFLSEYNSDEISEILKIKKINYKRFNIQTQIKNGDLLLASLNDKNINMYYDKIGKLLLTYQHKFIIVRKLDTSNYITDAHNIIMSLGFKLIYNLNENNLFYLFYAYNIEDYKKTPDWLNNEYWANPDLWEK